MDTPPKFNSLPLKSYLNQIGSRIVFLSHHGELRGENVKLRGFGAVFLMYFHRCLRAIRIPEIIRDSWGRSGISIMKTAGFKNQELFVVVFFFVAVKSLFAGTCKAPFALNHLPKKYWNQKTYPQVCQPH